MAPLASEGKQVAVTETAGEGSDINYLCLFRDETRFDWNEKKFHLNLPGDTSVTTFYHSASEKSSYKFGTFLLAHRKKDEEIIIDYNCDDSLHEILKDSIEKRHFFLIKQKDGIDPVKTDDTSTTVAVQDSRDDVASYVSSFFQLEGNSESTHSSSHTPYGSSYNQPLKSSTGYVGLVNQAMTCYLNSLLQTLFMTPEFRNALYKWRFEGKQTEESKSIPYQLQKLFLKLETSKKRAVETTDLTKSFGWDSSEAWQQHDVQELCRVLFDALEETLKNTDQSDLIQHLYQGEMKDYVKCLNCSHENSRKVNFLDIAVDIRPFGSQQPHSDVAEALKAFVAPETLEGNDQYFCEKCNAKQDAHKGFKFIKFPYLLTIQLKRFTFDYNTLQRIKLHDRLTFPFFIDLDEYLESYETDYLPEEKNGSTDESLAVLSEEEEKQSSVPVQNGESDPNDLKKSPNEYELFSILIHSGSALGGHYYAYIKSFDDNKWYCFNDQYVTEISTSDIEKSYGGGDKFRTGFHSSNFSSSTNAYMLMYRKKDNEKNMKFVKSSNWSSSLTDLCQYILKDEEDEHTKKEREKNMCKINLFCIHPKTKEKLEEKFEMHKDATLSETTEKAWKHLELENFIPLSQCRLIKYDNSYSSFEKSFEGEENTAISKLVGGIRYSYLSSPELLLEWRMKDQTFQVYEPGGATLKVYVFDLEDEDDQFDEFCYVHVPATCTVGDLKKLLEVETSLPAETLRIAIWKECHEFVLLENENRSLKLEGFYRSGKIFVEGLSEEDGKVEFKSSKFLERLHLFHNTVKLKVSLPSTEKEITVSFDKRITMRELKKKLEKYIGIDAEMFRVYRVFSNNHEFECVRLEDNLHSFGDETKLVVKLGRALKDGEKRNKLYLLNVHQKEHTKLFMEIIISSNLSVKTLKEQQIIPELEKQEKEVPSIDRLRFRKKSYKNPGRIFPESSAFERDIDFGSSSEFYLEILKEPDTVLNDDYLSLYASRWRPESLTLDPFEEVVLYKETTVENLKQKLEEKCGIPVDCIHIAKGNGLFPCTISVLDIHHQLSWNPEADKLGEYPMRITDDGSIIYYRDSREVLKTITDDQRREIRNKDSDVTRTKSTYYRKEKALKIYTSNGPR